VHTGESYEDAVSRELEEEAGIRETPAFMGAFKKRFDEKDKENVRVYGFMAKQELTINPEEIKQGLFMAPGELEEKMRNEKFLPETGMVYNILKEHSPK
jgi:isopentenyldiphosphate isomerase